MKKPASRVALVIVRRWFSVCRGRSYGADCPTAPASKRADCPLDAPRPVHSGRSQRPMSFNQNWETLSDSAVLYRGIDSRTRKRTQNLMLGELARAAKFPLAFESPLSQHVSERPSCKWGKPPRGISQDMGSRYTSPAGWLTWVEKKRSDTDYKLIFHTVAQQSSQWLRITTFQMTSCIPFYGWA